MNIPNVTTKSIPIKNQIRLLQTLRGDAASQIKDGILKNITNGVIQFDPPVLPDLQSVLQLLVSSPLLGQTAQEALNAISQPSTPTLPPLPTPIPAPSHMIKRNAEGPVIVGPNLAGISNKGGGSENEDALVAMERDGVKVMLVADGVGGNNAGEVASGIMVETTEQIFTADPQNFDLAVAIAETHARIQSAVTQDSTKKTMGTTVVGAVIKDSRATIKHLGDSKALLVRKGRIFQVTRDHSNSFALLSRYSIASPLLPSEVAAVLTAAKVDAIADISLPFSEELTAAIWPHSKISGTAIFKFIGAEKALTPDEITINLQPGDKLILLTDGATDYTSWDAFKQAVTDKLNAPAFELAKAIVDAASSSHDNVTAAVHCEPLLPPLPKARPVTLMQGRVIYSVGDKTDPDISVAASIDVIIDDDAPSPIPAPSVDAQLTDIQRQTEDLHQQWETIQVQLQAFRTTKERHQTDITKWHTTIARIGEAAPNIKLIESRREEIQSAFEATETQIISNFESNAAAFSDDQETVDSFAKLAEQQLLAAQVFRDTALQELDQNNPVAARVQAIKETINDLEQAVIQIDHLMEDLDLQTRQLRQEVQHLMLERERLLAKLQTNTSGIEALLGVIPELPEISEKS
ncbi:MAG: protein phosphatase 2C domain-containing protein [Candidatus Margulisiibacteriota bacterium]